MVRKEDWAKQLSNYLRERRDMPFQWGENDCLQFVARGVERLTGQNFWQQYLPYSTKEEVTEILSSNGGVTGIISKYLGSGHRQILKAKRGDVAIVKMPEITAGLVDDTGRFVLLMTEQGWQRFPLSLAWRIWSY